MELAIVTFAHVCKKKAVTAVHGNAVMKCNTCLWPCWPPLILQPFVITQHFDWYCAEDEPELDEALVDHPMADAPAIPVATVAAASACIDRVLQAVLHNLSCLLTEDNLQLRFLEVARHHLAGKDEAAELQVQLHDHGCCW